MSVDDDTNVKNEDTADGGWRAFDYDAEIDDGVGQRPDVEKEVGPPDASRGRTDFDISEAPSSERDRWKRLRKLNAGWREQDRATQLHEAGIERDLGAIATALDCSQRQKRRAGWLIDHVSIEDDLSRHASVEAAIVAALTLAANEDRRRIRGEDMFDDVCEDLDVDRDEVRRLRQRIRGTEAWG
jgi:hypothetical protein